MPEHVLLENFQKLLDENRDVMKIDFSDFADTKDLPDKISVADVKLGMCQNGRVAMLPAVTRNYVSSIFTSDLGNHLKKKNCLSM